MISIIDLCECKRFPLCLEINCTLAPAEEAAGGRIRRIEMEALGRALRSFHEKHEKVKHTVHTVSISIYKLYDAVVKRSIVKHVHDIHI